MAPLGVTPDAKTGSALEPVCYDWCADVRRRCDQIDHAISERHPDPSFKMCHTSSDQQLIALCQGQNACETLFQSCKQFRPILSPREGLEEEQKGETGAFHDLPSFYELSRTVIPLLVPTTDPVEILYFDSGGHVAPVELALQILKETSHDKVYLTMTEIEPQVLQQIADCLKTIDGLVISDPFLTKKTKTYREYEIGVTTASTKEVIIRFVLGLKQKNGRYPPHFQQTHFDRADIVIGFDVEDSRLITQDVGRAWKKSKHKKEKVMIFENRDVYVNWAVKKHHPIVATLFSQHFGCEDPKGVSGLGLQPFVFKLKK